MRFGFSLRCKLGIRSSGALRDVAKSLIPFFRYNIMVSVSRVEMCNVLGHFDL